MAIQNNPGLDETFDLLTHPHRRYVLYYLTHESEVVDLESLAAALATWDGDQTATGPSNDSDAIEVVLRHTHVPKLADAGRITFDTDTDVIELEGMNEHRQFVDEAARIDGYTQAIASD